MRVRYIQFSFFIITLLSSIHFAQTKTNFEQIDSLLKISARDLAIKIDNDVTYSLKFYGAESYSVLEPNLLNYLQSDGISFDNDKSKEMIINYTLSEAKVNYTELFKDGLFGDFLVRRKSEISGNYLIVLDNEFNENVEFNYEIIDTVLYSELSQLDNIAYPFATSNVPEEPFFSSSLEPIIAIGTAAVAVYLFFNIRSK